MAAHQHVDDEQHRERRHDRDEHAARNRVPHALPDHHADVEQPMAQDGVGERRREEQEVIVQNDVALDAKMDGEIRVRPQPVRRDHQQAGQQAADGADRRGSSRAAVRSHR